MFFLLFLMLFLNCRYLPLYVFGSLLQCLLRLSTILGSALSLSGFHKINSSFASLFLILDIWLPSAFVCIHYWKILLLCYLDICSLSGFHFSTILYFIGPPRCLFSFNWHSAKSPAFAAVIKRAFLSFCQIL